MIFSWIRTGKPDLGYSLNGALAGLVAITAGCSVVAPGSALIIGMVGGIIMLYGTRFLEIIRIDDPVGAIPVHGFAGIWGTLAVALFAQAPYTSQFTGLFFGGSGYQLLVQAVGVLAVFLWTSATAFLVFKIINKYHGLRVTESEEINGLDLNEHGTTAYPEFFGVNNARDMLELNVDQEIELLKQGKLSVDLEMRD